MILIARDPVTDGEGNPVYHHFDWSNTDCDAAIISLADEAFLSIHSTTRSKVPITAAHQKDIDDSVIVLKPPAK
jgi:hypothetical protein